MSRLSLAPREIARPDFSDLYRDALPGLPTLESLLHRMNTCFVYVRHPECIVDTRTNAIYSVEEFTRLTSDWVMEVRAGAER